jgi:hypothetical protein
MRPQFKMLFPRNQTETPMRYKSIVLQLLEQYPEFHEQLRSKHMLLSTMEQLARELKTCHEVWKDTLSQRNPDRV